MTLLNKEEIDTILSKIGLNEFKEEVKRKNNAGRKEKDYFNPFFESFREITDYDDLSPWVDDVLRGAGMLNEGTGTHHTTPLMLFHLIKSLPLYTSGEIKAHINRKRRVLGQHVIKSDSYPRWLRSVMHSAIESLKYHTEYLGNKLVRDLKEGEEVFSYSVDKDGWQEHKARCEALGVDPTTNLDNPLNDVPLNDRKLLAGLTVDEINGNRKSLYTSGEIELPSSAFKKDGEKDRVHKRHSKKEFEKIRKHFDSYRDVKLSELPDMVDLDTGELISYCTSGEITEEH